MPVSRALRRLLRVRQIEEQQSRLELEAILGEQNRLHHALVITGERERRGRSLVGVSAYNGELADRLAGLEETRSALRRSAALAARIADTEIDAADLREEFLARRIERRQAETLIRETVAGDALVTARRDQQDLDDWHRNRLHRAELEVDADKRAGVGPDKNEAVGEETKSLRLKPVSDGVFL